MNAYGYSKLRQADERAYGHYYTMWPEYPVRECFYCGEAASHLDHVPAVIDAVRYVDKGRKLVPFVKVRACENCNKTLGSTSPNRLHDRVRVLAERLDARYEKESRRRWAEDELATMGRQEQKQYRAYNAYLDTLHARIRFAQGRLAEEELFPSDDTAAPGSN